MKNLIFTSIIAIFMMNNLSAFLTGTYIDHHSDQRYILGTHRKIIEGAFAQFKFTKDEIWLICRGDFLTDAGQLLNSKSAKFFFRNWVTLKFLVDKECGKRPDKRKSSIEGVSWNDIGFYESTDHIDQPTIGKGLIPNTEQVSIDLDTNMMKHIKAKGEWKNSKDRILDKLAKALGFLREMSLIVGDEKKKSLYESKFWSAIGGVLHTRADYYAHSNFIELALINEYLNKNNQKRTKDNLKFYHQKIFPYVGEDTISPCGGDFNPSSRIPYCFPVVTGMSSRNNDEFILNVLTVSQNRLIKKEPTTRNPVKKYVHKIKSYLSGLASKVMSKFSGKFSKEMDKVLSDPILLGPTHHHLSKDLSNNPVHRLAVECAIVNQQEFGLQLEILMSKVNGRDEFDIQELERIAIELLVHPFHVTMDMKGPWRCLGLVRQFIENDGNADRIALMSFQNALEHKNKLF